MELHIVANRPHLVDLFEQFIYDVPDVRQHLHPSQPLTHRSALLESGRWATPGRFTHSPCL